MTAPTYPLVQSCARCGRLATAHKIRTDGRTRAGTDDGVCAGWEPGPTRELLPEAELRERLDAVLAIHFDYLGGDSAWCGRCNEAWPCETARAARGES